MKNNHKNAFTLAEILITLSIIGVIASMTIPSLVQDVQDAQYKTAWKKTYADLNQAAKLVILETGSFKGAANSNENNKIRNLFQSKFTTIKLCDQASSIQPCWSTKEQIDGLYDVRDDSAFITNSGTFMSFDYNHPDCNGTYSDCGFITIDVNGLKGPNKLGKDIYAAYINKKELKPVGYKNEFTCDLTGGLGCSAKYLYQ